MIGQTLLMRIFPELSEPIAVNSLIELGEVVLKIIKDNKLKDITEATLHELLSKGKGDPRRHQFLEMKKAQSLNEFEKETAQFPEGILASAYSSKGEYMAETVTDKLLELGMFSTTSKEEAIENIQGLFKKTLEYCIIKNNSEPAPYIIQLGLLVEALALYGIEQPKDTYENLKKTMKMIESLTSFKKDKGVIALEAMIEKEFSAIKISPAMNLPNLKN